MTYLQPNKNKSILNRAVAALSVALIVGVFGMVALYNATINLNHTITAAKTELDTIGAESTALNSKIVQDLGGTALDAALRGDGLVAETNPEYFPVHGPWPLASHY